MESVKLEKSDLSVSGGAEEALPEKNYNPYFRYPVSDWKGLCEVREERATYGAARFELSDYHAQGDAFWLPVTGDAMTAPSGLSVSAGMMILVDPAIAAEPGKLVVQVLGGQFDLGRSAHGMFLRPW